MYCIMNSGTSETFITFSGKGLVFFSLGNVGSNLLLVMIQTAFSLYNNAKEFFISKKKQRNLKAQIEHFKEISKTQKVHQIHILRHEAELHARKWEAERNWCLSNGLPISNLAEEKKHQGYIKAGMLLIEEEKREQRPKSNSKLRDKIRKQL